MEAKLPDYMERMLSRIAATEGQPKADFIRCKVFEELEKHAATVERSAAGATEQTGRLVWLVDYDEPIENTLSSLRPSPDRVAWVKGKITEERYPVPPSDERRKGVKSVTGHFAHYGLGIDVPQSELEKDAGTHDVLLGCAKELVHLVGMFPRSRFDDFAHLVAPGQFSVNGRNAVAAILRSKDEGRGIEEIGIATDHIWDEGWWWFLVIDKIEGLPYG